MSNYVIHVGANTPEKVIIATPDKDRRPIPETQIETHRTIGAHLLMNRARVFARRVLPNGKMLVKDNVETPMEVNDPNYKGHLQFLDWGSTVAGAQAIDVRYLPNSSSLDYEYQRTVQKIETTPEQGLDHIQLKSGENKFDGSTLLVQLLKVHPQNRNSKSKNPDPLIKGYQYFEITDETTDKSFVRKMEAAHTMGTFLMGLTANSEALFNLLEILTEYHVDFGEVNHLSNTTDVYRALLQYANTSPGDFAQHINRYKEELQKKFEYARSFKALDLTKDGSIGMTIGGKPHLVFDKVEGKGEAMIEWVVKNFYLKTVYDQSKYLRSLCDQLK
jgi:hypothetical protein